MKDLEQRLYKLERRARVSAATEHVISVLRVPAGLRGESADAWLAAQRRCDCSLGCPGKTVGMVVSDPLPPEAWVQEAERWCDKRSAP